MVIGIMFLFVWLGVSAYAIWRGGQPERLVGCIFLAAFPLSVVAYQLPWRAGGVEWGTAAVDAAMLIGLAAIALRAARSWPIVICAMQVFQLSSHFTQFAEPELSPLVYWIGSVIWAYFQLPLLLLGTIRHINRERRDGIEPSWRSSSGRRARQRP